MDKSGGNPSKSTKKGPTHGQDYTKNFIWTMVFTNKSSTFWRNRENVEIRLLYEKTKNRLISKITPFCTATRSRKFAWAKRLSFRRPTTKRHWSWFNQYFSALTPIKRYKSRFISKAFPWFSRTNSCKNTLYKAYYAVKNHWFKHIAT